LETETHRAIWINGRKRTAADVRVRVDPSRKPYGIGLHIAPT
jgi:hypothetical protein